MGRLYGCMVGITRLEICAVIAEVNGVILLRVVQVVGVRIFFIGGGVGMEEVLTKILK